MQCRRKRVVVTGLGAVSPLGLDVVSTWRACLAGESGIRRVTVFDVEHWPVKIGGEVVGFDLTPYLHDSYRDLAPLLSRGPQFGVAAASMAMDDSGLSDLRVPPHRIGCSLGSLNTSPSLAEMNRWRHLEQDFDPPRYAVVGAVKDLWMSQVAAARVVCDRWRCGGPYYLTSAACASGTMSLGVALKALRRGEADVMLAGGFDGMLDETTSMSFALLGALSTRNDEPSRASRPFDLRRDGFVLAEGAAVLVLEELDHALRRGAKIYAEVAGYASSMTSEHITDTSPDGRHSARAMTLALEDAAVQPEQV
ncbi:MAG: beta-ketoacyl-[acyl-carrier-protein] synthase family protein, partial [Planctomycetaceae bacterium]|nr:beta-ketoacyl-[acyl-carrier-protein] synthase family protein [Planctomycetaceae bacterium]